MFEWIEQQTVSLSLSLSSLSLSKKTHLADRVFFFFFVTKTERESFFFFFLFKFFFIFPQIAHLDLQMRTVLIPSPTSSPNKLILYASLSDSEAQFGEFFSLSLTLPLLFNLNNNKKKFISLNLLWRVFVFFFFFFKGLEWSVISPEVKEEECNYPLLKENQQPFWIG